MQPRTLRLLTTTLAIHLTLGAPLCRADAAGTRIAAHPLDPLSKDELATTAALLKDAGKVADSTRFALIHLHEPAKERILAYRPGQKLPRQAFAILCHWASWEMGELFARRDRGAWPSADRVVWAANGSTLFPLGDGATDSGGTGTVRRTSRFRSTRARGHPRTTQASIARRATELFGRRTAARFFRWEMVPLTVAEQAALPERSRGCRRSTYRFTFTLNAAAASAAAVYDGLSALVTTAPRTQSADVLFTQYKEQKYVELGQSRNP